MNVLVSASAHFVVTEDGGLWSGNGSLGYAFWTRYLDVFDEVRLIVRASSHPTAPAGWNRATGDGVVGVPVPDFRSLRSFVSVYPSLRKRIKEVLTATSAVCLRVPCPLGETVWRTLERQRPYGVEVVGDPYGTLSPGAVDHPLRPLLRWWFRRQLRRQCAHACASAYVTERDLQARYPGAAGKLSTHYSSAEIPSAAFTKLPRWGRPSPAAIRVVTVGSLSRLYKATDVLIHAVRLCVKDSLDIELTVVGEGRYRAQLESQARSAGLGGRVRFTGQLASPAAVREELDRAELFVLPSVYEGLPKAMIEAMARGLPCIGSNVGGIPELLSAEDIVPPNHVIALAAKIREVVDDKERLGRMSARNLEKAKEYRSEVLRPRRVDFYRCLRSETEEWLASRRSVTKPGLVCDGSEGKVTS